MDYIHKLNRREFILASLGLIGCSDELEEIEPVKIFHSIISQSSFDLDAQMDVLNLQSNSAANFTTSSGKVTQWNDLSGNARHATQSNDTYRPLYNGGEILFDGTNDALQIPAEVTLSTFSFYAVVKSTDITNTQAITGGNSSDSIGKTAPRDLLFNGGENLRYNLYGDEYYQVISCRRDGSTITIKVNGRTLFKTSGTIGSQSHNFRYIGTGAFGPASLPWNGIIRAVSISSSYLDDATDTQVLNALFTRYSLPQTSDCVVGFGDSITYGQGATNALTTAWMPLLKTQLGKAGYKNYGIGSSVCSNVAGSATNGQDRWDLNIPERPYSDTICILYGTNDISAGGVYTATTYESALIEIVSGLIATGYAANKICIGTVPYRSNDGFASTIAQYNAKIASVTTTYGLRGPATVYEDMKAYGNGCLDDSVHPNDIGHQIIADAFELALT